MPITTWLAFAKSLRSKGAAGSDGDQSAAAAKAAMDKAFECLQQIFDLGCFDDPAFLDEMKRDGELDSLRSQAEYKATAGTDRRAGQDAQHDGEEALTAWHPIESTIAGGASLRRQGQASVFNYNGC